MLTQDQRILTFQSLVNSANDSFLVDIDNIINYLTELGYFTAPASTKFHLSYEGGLIEHSFSVTKELLELTKNNSLKWERKDSPIIIGLFHDLCKADAYVNVNGFWLWNKAQPVNGHGEKSLIYYDRMSDNGLVRPLTDEERMCIRWHMGAFDEKENWSSYMNAIHIYPNVLWTHMADMVSSHITELSDSTAH